MSAKQREAQVPMHQVPFITQLPSAVNSHGQQMVTPVNVSNEFSLQNPHPPESVTLAFRNVQVDCDGGIICSEYLVR